MAQRGIDNLKSNQSQVEPYVPADKNIPEVTITALILGAILSIVMGAANTYLGLRAGMTVSASIPAAVISMAILRKVLRRGTILENNIVQTMASTGESLAAGAIFTVPALVLIGEWKDFEFWPTTLIVMLGGLLGVVFMVPMRRALIVGRPDLVYPEGVACSEVLIVGEEGGAGILSIASGLAIGAVFKFMVSGLHLIQDAVKGAIARGRSVFYLGSDMSLALVAVGYIVNLHIASLITLGGVIAWLVAIPLLGGYEPGMVPMEVARDIWATQVRYMGVGAMLVGGLYSVWHVRRGIVAGVAGLRGVTSGVGKGSTERPRTDRDMPLGWLLAVLLLTTFATFFFYDYLVGSVGVAAITATIMIITAFLFVAVATYIVGLVGSSNSPVSGMTICALLIAAGTLLGLGIRGESAILATLGVAGVVCCAACTAGDVAQDLKTGQLVGATPARQQWTEILGAIIPAFFFAPIMSLLHNSYVIGSDSLAAPQATLFASLTSSFFGEGPALPWNMIGIGAAIGVGLIVTNRLLELSGSSFRTHVMPVAVGIYLPFSLVIPIFIGGLIRHFFSRRSVGDGPSEAQDSGVLFGSGLIAGEAIMGILLAIPLSRGFTFREGEGNWAVSLLTFGAILALYASLARRSRRAAS